MKKNFIPKGPYAVLMTPFNEDGSIDFEAYETEVEFLASSDIAGLFPCATTGEFVHTSPEENMKLIEVCAKVNRGRKSIAAGACATNLDTVEMYARCADACGCDAIVVCVPYYITLPQPEVKEFFLRLSKRLPDINIILYNIPMFTGEIAVPTIEALLECDNIVGIKDSSQNMKRICHTIDIKNQKKPDFAVFCGTDDMLLPALTAGCTGSMTAMSAILPEANARIYSLYAEGKIKEAQELNMSYLKLVRLCDSLPFPAGYKLAFEKRGMRMGNKQIVSIEGTEEYDRISAQMEQEMKKFIQ